MVDLDLFDIFYEAMLNIENVDFLINEEEHSEFILLDENGPLEKIIKNNTHIDPTM